jgi:integrase
MPKQQRFKTDYPGVYYIIGTKAGTDKPERVFYISFYKDGKKIEEKAGRQFKDAMTAARANRIRAQKIDGTLPTNKERREAAEAEKNAKADKWTIDRLWEKYKNGRTKNKALSTDDSRYNKYLKPIFENREPKEIVALDVDRLRINLLKKKSPQTVKHILNLLTWIINFGVNNGLCEGISFRMKKPEINNVKTEDLTPDQLSNLLKAIEEDPHPQAGSMMKLALYTGLRRGEMFKLKWEHINYDRNFINIVDPKGGPDQKIPLNDAARELLENHPKTKSPYVFPGRSGGQRKNISEAVNEIKKKAKLPKDFRPLHGLRHTYASALASSGKVDMYVLQKLLTHKSPQMTQRYAHLRDKALADASNVAVEIFQPKKISKRIIKVKSTE